MLKYNFVKPEVSAFNYSFHLSAVFMGEKFSIWILLISLLLIQYVFSVLTIFALNLFVLWAFHFFNILLALCYALKTFIPWSCGKIANHNWKIYFLVYFRWLKDWHSLHVTVSVFLSGKNHFLKHPEPDSLCSVGHFFLLPGQNGFRALPTLRISWK